MARDRRQFLAATATLSAAVLSSAGTALGAAGEEHHGEEEIPATEDLMREHGVLDRLLLIYEEALRRLVSKREVAPEAFHKPAEVVQSFVENYHEKLEEKFIFPEFEKRNTLVDLVAVLRRQHAAGRTLTEVILARSSGGRFQTDDSARRELVAACRSFIRMYRPHAAREDTVLFPEFREVLPADQIEELGEQFEEEEDRLFGEGGFRNTVDQVAAIEKQLGIDDLARFTPRLPAD